MIDNAEINGTYERWIKNINPDLISEISDFTFDERIYFKGIDNDFSNLPRNHSDDLYPKIKKILLKKLRVKLTIEQNEEFIKYFLKTRFVNFV